MSREGDLLGQISGGSDLLWQVSGESHAIEGSSVTQSLPPAVIGQVDTKADYSGTLRRQSEPAETSFQFQPRRDHVLLDVLETNTNETDSFSNVSEAVGRQFGAKIKTTVKAPPQISPKPTRRKDYEMSALSLKGPQPSLPQTSPSISRSARETVKPPPPSPQNKPMKRATAPKSPNTSPSHSPPIPAMQQSSNSKQEVSLSHPFPPSTTVTSTYPFSHIASPLNLLPSLSPPPPPPPPPPPLSPPSYPPPPDSPPPPPPSCSPHELVLPPPSLTTQLPSGRTSMEGNESSSPSVVNEDKQPPLPIRKMGSNYPRVSPGGTDVECKTVPLLDSAKAPISPMSSPKREGKPTPGLDSIRKRLAEEMLRKEALQPQDGQVSTNSKATEVLMPSVLSPAATLSSNAHSAISSIAISSSALSTFTNAISLTPGNPPPAIPLPPVVPPTGILPPDKKLPSFPSPAIPTSSTPPVIPRPSPAIPPKMPISTVPPDIPFRANPSFSSSSPVTHHHTANQHLSPRLAPQDSPPVKEQRLLQLQLPTSDSCPLLPPHPTSTCASPKLSACLNPSSVPSITTQSPIPQQPFEKVVRSPEFSPEQSPPPIPPRTAAMLQDATPLSPERKSKCAPESPKKKRIIKGVMQQYNNWKPKNEKKEESSRKKAHVAVQEAPSTPSNKSSRKTFIDMKKRPLPEEPPAEQCSAATVDMNSDKEDDHDYDEVHVFCSRPQPQSNPYIKSTLPPTYSHRNKLRNEVSPVPSFQPPLLPPPLSVPDASWQPVFMPTSASNSCPPQQQLLSSVPLVSPDVVNACRQPAPLPVSCRPSLPLPNTQQPLHSGSRKLPVPSTSSPRSMPVRTQSLKDPDPTVDDDGYTKVDEWTKGNARKKLMNMASHGYDYPEVRGCATLPRKLRESLDKNPAQAQNFPVKAPPRQALQRLCSPDDDYMNMTTSPGLASDGTAQHSKADNSEYDVYQNSDVFGKPGLNLSRRRSLDDLTIYMNLPDELVKKITNSLDKSPVKKTLPPRTPRVKVTGNHEPGAVPVPKNPISSLSSPKRSLNMSWRRSLDDLYMNLTSEDCEQQLSSPTKALSARVQRPCPGGSLSSQESMDGDEVQLASTSTHSTASVRKIPLPPRNKPRNRTQPAYYLQLINN